jgi:hypothetical protein
MVQAVYAGRPDIHAGTFSDRLQAFKNLNILSRIIGFHAFYRRLYDFSGLKTGQPVQNGYTPLLRDQGHAETPGAFLCFTNRVLKQALSSIEFFGEKGKGPAPGAFTVRRHLINFYLYIQCPGRMAERESL